MLETEEQRVALEAQFYRDQKEWAAHTQSGIEYLTIINEEYKILFTNHLQPGVPDPTGNSCLDFVPPDQRCILQGAIEKTFCAGLPQHFETKATGPDGELSYYSGWAHLRRNEEGAAHVVLVGTDITHLRRIEEKLIVSDKTLHSLVANAPDFIGIIERDHTLSFLNRALSEDANRVAVGSTIEKFLPEEEKEKVYGAIERVFNTGKNEAYEIAIPLAHKKGDDTIFSTRLSPIMLGDEVKSVTLISTDITKKYRADESFRASEEKLMQRQKLQALGQLTGGIAHDFNNLLMVIRSSLEEAEVARNDPNAVYQLVQIADEAVERAAALTHRLLAFGRKQSLSPQNLTIRTLFVKITELFRRTLGPQVAIDVQLSSQIWQCVADPEQLESALLNLAINGRDAMGEAGGQLKLSATNYTHTVTTSKKALGDLKEGHYVCLSVTDNGIGIDAASLAKVFEPFFTTKSTGQGNGLGLSMVYGFTQQSGGHVEMRSVLGKGTNVTLYLPRAPEKNEELSKALSRKKQLLSEGKGQEILLVEDEPTVARLTQRLIKRLGYEVTHVTTAALALKHLSQNKKTRLLFTDIVLPGGMSGVGLCKEALAISPHLRVLFMTGYENGFLPKTSHQRVLSKPFTGEELAKELNSLLSPS